MAAVRLVINPSTDTELEREAEHFVRVARSAPELEDMLRTRYHDVHVVPGVTDIFERWYVYREGHWVNSR